MVFIKTFFNLNGLFICNKIMVLRMFLNEEKIVTSIVEELTKPDVVKLIKSSSDVKSEFKKIATEVIVKLFKILWQQHNFYEGELKK